MTAPLLTVDQVTVELATRRGMLRAVADVSLTVAPGEFLGIVGESGCGKTTLALAILGLLAPNATASGSIMFRGQDLLGMTQPDLRKVRGSAIGYIPQDPLVSLDPTFGVGSQIAETIRAHRTVTRRQAHDEAVELMDRVGIPDPGKRYRHQPHLFSGGMRQRIAIAIALANAPALIVADEPTTALDVTVQQQVLELMTGLAREHGTAVILVSHDLAVVADVCDRMAVLYAGEVAELGTAGSLLQEPMHPYTTALLRSTPSRRRRRGELEVIPGEVPDPLHPATGCPFAPRCGSRMEKCDEVPPWVALPHGRAVSCWLTADSVTAEPGSTGDPLPVMDAARKAGD